MALSATLFRFTIQLSDLDKHCYERISLNVAQHPSETTERMLLRVIAYCFEYAPGLSFTRGLSTDSEPDIWRHQDNGTIASWIELGCPEPKRLRKACGQSESVVIYAYGEQNTRRWWQQAGSQLKNLDKVRTHFLDGEQIRQLVDSLKRSNSLTCLIEDGIMQLGWDQHFITINRIPMDAIPGQESMR